MQSVQSIRIEDYSYHLPDEYIAKYPLEKRDDSKLLVYENGRIQESIFHTLAEHIPVSSLLIFNDTKVINARLVFYNTNNARIELFILDGETTPLEQQLSLSKEVSVVCMVGNLNKWKDYCLTAQKTMAQGNVVSLKAEKKNIQQTPVVHLSWTPEEYTFSEIIDLFGETPLPPYLNREAEEEDKHRYQTIFARQDGSVAAPTAALHFTKSVLDSVQQKGCTLQEVTLHVGAGTFKPVKAETMQDHAMHSERVIVSKSLIQQVLACKDSRIAVGTTSMRTLESLYWFGVKLLSGKTKDTIQVSQWDPYELPKHYSLNESFSAIEALMTTLGINYLQGETSLLIAPGYSFHVCDAIITNFHQPKSTLLLLVAAFVGEDYKKVYEYALANNFRFLSYGDSSLLWKNSAQIQ